MIKVKIRGKEYEIMLEERKLVDVTNPKCIIYIKSEDQLDHFRSVVRGY